MRTIQQLSGVAKRFPNVTWSCLSKSYLHTSAQLQDSTTSDRVSPEMKRTSNDEKIARKKTYLKYNLIKYEPSKEGEELRPAEVVHQKEFILISPKKMWYPAVMIRGMSIDEAINQCEFSGKSAAKVIRDVLKEAQRLAVSSYNVEFKSNLWVADSFVEKSGKLTSVRRKARNKATNIECTASRYVVRLREGQPPEHYYPPVPTGQEKLAEYITDQRRRRIFHGL